MLVCGRNSTGWPGLERTCSITLGKKSDFASHLLK